MKQSGGIIVRGHAISGVFVFMLLGVFALSSVFMIVIGAQQYRATISDTAQHSAERVLNSYLLNTLRGNDEANVVSIKEQDGIEVLASGYSIDGTVYETKIYCYEGIMRELFGYADDPFVPENGEKICEMEALEFAIDGNMLEMHITGADGESRTLYSSLYCGIAEEG